MRQALRVRVLKNIGLGWLAAGVVLGVGCDRRDEIAVYEVPKEAANPHGNHVHPPGTTHTDDHQSIAADPSPEDQGPAGAQGTSEGGTETGEGSAPHSAGATDVAADDNQNSAGGGSVMRALAKGIQWQVPKQWRRVPIRSSQMRLASFAAGKGTAAVDISVTVLAGDAGGLRANINRWRGQLGLSPVSTLREQPMSQMDLADGRQAKIVELWQVDPEGGSGFAKGMLGAIVEGEGRTWFVKVTGLRDAVLGQREALEQFVGSMRWIRESVMGD